MQHAASEFKFLGYRVTKVLFDLKDEYFQFSEHRIKQSIDIHQRFHTENKRFVEVGLDIKVGDERGFIVLTVSIKGGFEANPDMPEETFKGLYTVNAPAILYPFARAIVTTYTAQANMPPIVLPAVNFAGPLEAKKTESKSGG